MVVAEMIAPPCVAKAPEEPVFTPRAVTTPVPVVTVAGAAPAPPPIIKEFAASAADVAHVLAPLKYGMPPLVPATVRARVPEDVTGEPVTEIMPPVKDWPTLVTVPALPAMLMVPAPLVMVMLAPADSVVRANPVPLPISISPLAGAAVSPVPPLATATVLVTLAALPVMLPLTALPAIAIVVLVTLVT